MFALAVNDFVVLNNLIRVSFEAILAQLLIAYLDPKFFSCRLSLDFCTSALRIAFFETLCSTRVFISHNNLHFYLFFKGDMFWSVCAIS